MESFNLKSKRKQLDLTQQQLAEKLGVSTRAVQLWEYGQRKISKANERLLTQFFDEHLHEQNPGPKPGSIDSQIEGIVEEKVESLEEKLKKFEETIAGLDQLINEKIKAQLSSQATVLLNQAIEGSLKTEFKEINETLLSLFRKGMKQDKKIELLEGQHLKKSN